MLHHALFMHGRPCVLKCRGVELCHPHIYDRARAAVDGDLRIFVLSLASQLREDGCSLVYKMFVGLWSWQIVSGACSSLKFQPSSRCF